MERAVSLASFGQRTPNGIRVGPVYTPPGLRGNGYASALVGQMTAELLGLHRFCFLFTDLANPTANGIYQRIGYEAVSDVSTTRSSERARGQWTAMMRSSTAE